jgi:hypothetical protein
MIFSILKILHSTLLHLPPLRLQCIGGCWELIIEPRTIAAALTCKVYVKNPHISVGIHD